MQYKLFVFSLCFFSLFASAQEVQDAAAEVPPAELPPVQPKDQIEGDKDQQRIEALSGAKLTKHSDKEKTWVFHDKTLLGSNFTYGETTSVDIALDSESSVSYKKHSLEDAIYYYSYYYQGQGTPLQRYKGKFDVSLKYLYEIYPHWSPFVGIKYENIYEVKANNHYTTENQDYDGGLRYSYSVDKTLDFIFEISHRVSLVDSPDLVGTTQNLRLFSSIYYYANSFGFGLWSEAVAPYHNMGDYIIDFGPDITYTFSPGSKFFIGLTASARWQGQQDYPGASLFNVWSGVFYTGVKF